jgi:hypothetical protein
MNMFYSGAHSCLARKNIRRLPPPVKLERRHITYIVSVGRKTQSNKQTNRNMLRYYAFLGRGKLIAVTLQHHNEKLDLLLRL